MMSVLGIVALLFAFDHARPNVKLNVSYKGSRDEMSIEVTTHYGSAGGTFKRGEDRLVSEGRGFPEFLHVAWGTNNFRNYSREFSKDFDVKGKIQRFGMNETLTVTVTDENAQLDVGSVTDGGANRRQ